MPVTVSRSNFGSDAPVRGPMRRSLVQVLALIGIVAVLAVLLPGPAQLVHAFSNGPLQGHSAPRHHDVGSSVADASMLLVCSIAVWLLLIWVSVAAGLAVLGLVPGTVGHRARSILRGIVPRAARNAL